MIFRPEFAALVLTGTKTQTRRPVKPDDRVIGEVKPCPYVVGKTYAVQPGRGKKAVGRLRVLEVTRVTVAAIDPDDARAEGFNGVVDFLAWWHGFYDTVHGECWRIRFEVAE